MQKYYISFGQIHAHAIGGKTFDKDCVAEIEADNKIQAHDIAMEIFNGKFCFVNEEPNLEYYPRGIIKL